MSSPPLQRLFSQLKRCEMLGIAPGAAAWNVLIFCLGLQATTVEPARAQFPSADTASGELVIPRLNGTIELDGRIREGAWDGALRLPLVQSRPDFGTEPTLETEVLVGYTEEYLFAACRCYDPGTPLAPSFKRDYRGWSDAFQILLDTFNDNENALGFYTTPTGLRLDLAVRDDATGSAPLDIDWNTFWDVEVVQNEEGWFAEMRIPISSLRFEPDATGRVVMGLTVMRFIPRNSEVATFPAISANWGTFSHMKPSQARKVVFHGLDPQTPLRVTPYALGGAGQQNVLTSSGTRYEMETDPTYDVGLDVKYGLTSNLTLDLTLNTDFAQVEADNQQVNLTRFSLFFPEKRRFFLERSSNFAFNFGGPNRLFHSRRIGLHAGEQVRILGGARIVGRSGSWDIGLLNMQTARETGLGPDGATLPSENFGVVRLRRRVLNPYSYVGGIVTSRVGSGGVYNVAYGLDGIFRVTGDEYLSMKWAQTFEDNRPNRVASLDPARVLLQWERRRYDGLNYELSYGRAGERYHPGIGFELRDDFFRVGDRLSYGWLPEGESRIQAHRVNLLGKAYFRNDYASLESLTLGPEWEMVTNTGHRFSAGARHRIEDLKEPFLLGDVVVTADRYAFQEAELSYGTPSSREFWTRFTLTGGRFFDGQRGSVGVRPTWNASRYFRLAGAYQLDRVSFPDEDQGFTSHVARLRLEVTPNLRYSFQPFIQFNSLGDAILANVRFRYNPREGTDLYVVFNERLDTARPLVQPRAPLTTSRTLLIKYTYTFGW